MEYRVEPKLDSLHGSWDRARPPILVIDPGDTVTYRTLDASWLRVARQIGEWAPEFEVDDAVADGHALSGPVTVRGAEPGDAIDVEIISIRPASWGWTWNGPRPQLPRYNSGIVGDTQIIWTIDADRGIATDRGGLGITIDVRPFMGVMGNAPAEGGRHSTYPPRRVGGNIDCREFVAGSTLSLPVEVPGALFSVGDGHAAQGDGEVGQTAIECPMEQVTLRFGLRKNAGPPGPQGNTPLGFVTLGFGDSLDDAAAMALEAMLLHLERTHGLRRGEAMALASLVVNLHVTQVVNQLPGVHAILPHGAIRR